MLEIDPDFAARIVALRPSIEALIVRSCIHPESLNLLSDDDIEFIEILKEISSETNWLPEDLKRFKDYQPVNNYQQNYGENQFIQSRSNERDFFNHPQQQYNSTSVDQPSTFFTVNGKQYTEFVKKEKSFDPIPKYNEMDHFNVNYMNQSKKIKLHFLVLTIT